METETKYILYTLAGVALGIFVYWMYKKRDNFQPQDPSSVCAFLVATLSGDISDSDQQNLYTACSNSNARCGTAATYSLMLSMLEKLQFKTDPTGSVKAAINAANGTCSPPVDCKFNNCPQYYGLSCSNGLCL